MISTCVPGAPVRRWLRLDDVSVRAGETVILDRVSLCDRARRADGADRPERLGQDDAAARR